MIWFIWIILDPCADLGCIVYTIGVFESGIGGVSAVADHTLPYYTISYYIIPRRDLGYGSVVSARCQPEAA